MPSTAHIDGKDHRVAADIAVLGTGVTPLADLSVVGGHDCTTGRCKPRASWDTNMHGTHVAGTAAAVDNRLRPEWCQRARLHRS